MNQALNKSDAPNPAIALSFQIERQWRRVGDPGRSAMEMLSV
jgi:hypothetical protein